MSSLLSLSGGKICLVNEDSSSSPPPKKKGFWLGEKSLIASAEEEGRGKDLPPFFKVMPTLYITIEMSQLTSFLFFPEKFFFSFIFRKVDVNRQT